MGSFTVKVSYVRPSDFYGSFFSSLARLLSWFSSFGFLEPEKSIEDLLNGWTVCLNKLVKFFFFKKVLVRMFFLKKHFCGKSIIFQRFIHNTLFFLSSVFFFFWGGGGAGRVGGFRHSMLMIFLSWVLYYAYKKCSNSWGHSTITHALMEEGRGGTPKMCENIQGEGDLQRVYVSLFLFKGVFSHLECLFLFFTSLMGKRKL